MVQFFLLGSLDEKLRYLRLEAPKFVVIFVPVQPSALRSVPTWSFAIQQPFQRL